MTLRLRRARTLALYTCAPLLAMPVAFGLSLAIAYLTDGGLRGPQAIQYLFYASVVFASIILVLAPLAWWWAQVVLVLRATDSTLKGASAALLLPLFWLLCAALFLFLIPWLVRYVALLVGALR